MSTTTIEVPARAKGEDAALTVRELLLELGRVEAAELRDRPLPLLDDERRRLAALRRREAQLVAEIQRRPVTG